jgi:glycerol kinase
MRHVIAIDQGTTGTTVLVIDEALRVVGRDTCEFRQIYPQPGWVEHDPEDIWRSVVKARAGAMARAQVAPGDLAAIGITNQRETAVVWERATSRPVHHAIVWQDRRTADKCRQLTAAGVLPVVRRKTGLVLDPYFSGTKLGWMLENVPGARKRAAKGELAFGTIDSWLIWNLTKGEAHVTDFTNASRTLLFDIGKRRWDAELCKAMRVAPEVLPEVRPSAGVFGETAPGIVGTKRIPIAGVAGDQQAALFGQACFKAGMVKNTYGTGCFMLMYTGNEPLRSKNRLLTTIACAADGSPAYALEGSVFIAGAAVQWLRDGLRLIGTAGESEAAARRVDSTLGTYLVPAFAGLGAPYWDADARGALIGLTRGVTADHVVRATLESLAYQTRDVVEAMSADSGKRLRILRVDGGAVANDFLMQFQADLLGVRVERPEVIETTAAGAAFLAGVGVGIWKSGADLERVRRVDRTFEPAMSTAGRRRLYDGWQAAVARVRS